MSSRRQFVFGWRPEDGGVVVSLENAIDRGVWGHKLFADFSACGHVCRLYGAGPCCRCATSGRTPCDVCRRGGARGRP